MTDYLSTILQDEAFRLTVVTFSGLFLSVFIIGYFISLLISLLNIISGNNRGKG